MTTTHTTAAPVALTVWPQRRLRLKHHVFFRDTPDGVQFDGGTRSLLLPGAGLQRLVERVIALMDQGISLPELQARLPERLQSPVWRVIQALDEHGLLLDETGETPWLTQADVPLPLSEFVKYLQDRADPEMRRARWSDWRAGRLLLAGDGHALRAAARALADAGVGELRLRLEAGSTETDLLALREHLEAAGIEGQRLELIAAAVAPADFEGVLAAVWASDHPEGASAAVAFEQASLQHAVPAVVALRAAGMALVAPPVEAGLPGVHELLEWQQAVPAEPHSPASLALMGVVAAQAVMDRHFGIAAAQWQRRIRRVSPYLEISQHPLVAAGERPDPRVALAPLSPQAFAGLLGQPPDRTLSGYEQQRVALTPWFDPAFGPLAWRPAGAAGVLSQLPLYHDAIAVRAPRSVGAGASQVVGWGLNAEQAGTRALQLAISQLASRLAPEHSAEDLVTAFDPERWQALALAQALASHPTFADQRQVAAVALEDSQDPLVRLLRQLLRYFAAEPARVLLHWHPHCASCVAQVFVGQRLAGSACDATALPAIQEALGQACSRLQVSDAALWRGRTWNWAEPRADQWQAVPASLDAVHTAATAGVRWLPMDSLNLPSGVICGRAVIEPSEALA